jgi:hypothetical protein
MYALPLGRRMRIVTLAPLVAALAFAGCLTTATIPTEPLVPSALPALAAGFAVVGCDEQAAILPVPASAAEGLPEGFAPVPMDPAGATVGVFTTVYACGLRPAAEGSALIGQTRELIAFLMVTPPAEFAGAEGTLHGIWWAAMTSHEDAAAAYSAWKVPMVEMAEVTLEGQDTPAGRVGIARAASANETFTYRSVATGPAAEGQPGVLRAFSVEDGQVVHIVEFSWNAYTEFGGSKVVMQYEANGGPAMMPPPVHPGVGFHGWGDEYGWTALPIPLPMPGETPAEGTPQASPLRTLRGLVLG